ncbi:MAG: A/G-specific adenine glycosylase [Gammaproteobacteria bacterium]|nr:A/G-specific adenine glycosylase [Gammaproteobacteria bacterium]MDH5594755.1 A/G-specific adenine glycosylase [Gammaproteobacteria bacterium]MDH5613776.1 A/G-specific adenine glycosylase [Gammaproteobacteria bacterium]
MIEDFSQQLLSWFDQHGRHDLPWQKQITPYRVWVSEIMLQQTQVTTVIPYYEKFIQRFPEIESLATAPLDEVLHYWSGLGYYARARNLHKCAQMVVNEFNSEFPDNIEQMIALPGIGRSTAGAIQSIAHNQRHPILDGNVKRVLARLYAIEGWPGIKKIENKLWQLADFHTPHERVADYTQAIMDLGATVCTRSKPRCQHCPGSVDCKAHRLGTETTFPEKKPKKILPVRKTALLVVTNKKGEVLLEKRPPTGIWGGLWSLPECDHDNGDTQLLNHWCRDNLGIQLDNIKYKPGFRHTFSHYHLDITPVSGQIRNNHSLRVEEKETFWYNVHQPDARGLATPVTQVLNELKQETKT